MKTSLRFLLAILTLLTALNSFAKDKPAVYVLNFNQQKHSKYLILPSHKNRRWKNSTVYWWYNPSHQYYDTDVAVSRIKKAMQKWQNVCNIKFIYRGITYKRRISNALLVEWLPGSYLKDAAAVGITYPSGKYIKSGILGLNYDDFYYKDYNALEFEGILTHEIGHIIGLAHSNVPSSIMYASPYHDPIYMLTLKKDDIKGAQALYPYTSSQTSSQTSSKPKTKDADYFLEKFYQKYKNFFGKKKGGIYNCGRNGSFRCQNFYNGRKIAVHKQNHHIYYFNHKWKYFGDGDRYWK